jgi:hypothetical protein
MPAIGWWNSVDMKQIMDAPQSFLWQKRVEHESSAYPSLWAA